MIDENQLHILGQLIEAMEEATIKLEKAGNKGDEEGLNKARKEILGFQEQISSVIKEVGE